MNRQLTTIERAYELAKSGEVRTITEIRDRLREEGYSDAKVQIYGRVLLTDLRRLCVAAYGASDSG